MAHTPRTAPINVSIDRITPGYRQAVFQFSIINLTNRIRKKNLSTPPQLTTCHKWHHTTSHCLFNIFTKFANEECPFFSDYLRRLAIKFRHAPVKIKLMSLAKYNQSFMLSSSKLKLRNSVARKVIEVLTLFERAHSKLPGRHTVNKCLAQVKTSVVFN